MNDAISKIDGRSIFLIDASGKILGTSKPAHDSLANFRHSVSTIHTVFPGVVDELFKALADSTGSDATVTRTDEEFWIVDLHNKTYWLERKDISAHRSREIELLQLKKLIRKVEELASLGDMVAQISHEINTPLGICITSTSHLADKVQFLEEEFSKGSLTQSGMRDALATAQKAIRLTNSNLARTSKIINGLRSLSQDTRRHDKEKLVLHQYVDNVTSQINPLLEKGRVDLELSIPTDIWIYESPSTLSQVFSNLIVNSLRHGFAQRPADLQPKISISAKAQNEWVEVTYCDNGSGVPDHVRPHIFEPFVSGGLDSASTGLGMSIIREIVHDRFGGEVDLPESSDGFKFRFTMRRYL
ncbi:HAMP domain-containing histidine kinase [Ponticoccus sp. SC6-38]|nr:HAMP domain-containing histidine kinase [Ponticoccus sp. SC6-38]MBM1292405.1 HAMP domain-containing histidine kinase [Ponticoccus sp. SC6-11]